MKRLPLLLIILFSSATPVFSGENAYSLDQLTRMALEHNPAIVAAQEQCNQASGGLTRAEAGYLPQIGVAGNLVRQNIDGLTPEEDTVRQASLQASQLLYDFGKTGGAIAAGRHNLAAAANNYLQTRQDVVFQLQRSFFTVLEREKLVDVARLAVENFERHLHRATRFYEAGVRTRIDVTNAQVELSNARLDLLRAESNLQAARVALEKILGMIPENGSYTLRSDDGPLEQFSANKPPMPGSMDNTMASAMENRPLLRQMESLLAAAGASVRQAKGDYFPSINALAGYDDYSTDLPSIRDQWQVGVGLRWDLFSGFATDGLVAQAKGRQRELQARKQDLVLAITEDVTDSYLRADENRKSVDLADETMQLAAENLRLAEERYKAGLNDMIEFNDAQLSFTNSQSNLVSAFYSYRTALARIEHATGIIAGLPEANDAQAASCGIAPGPLP